MTGLGAREMALQPCPVPSFAAFSLRLSPSPFIQSTPGMFVSLTQRKPISTLKANGKAFGLRTDGGGDCLLICFSFESLEGDRERHKRRLE